MKWAVKKIRQDWVKLLLFYLSVLGWNTVCECVCVCVSACVCKYWVVQQQQCCVWWFLVLHDVGWGIVAIDCNTHSVVWRCCCCCCYLLQLRLFLQRADEGQPRLMLLLLPPPPRLRLRAAYKTTTSREQPPSLFTKVIWKHKNIPFLLLPHQLTF